MYMLNNDINIAVIPVDITWNDRDENLFATSQLIKKLRPETDIAVLPELFSTGYISDTGILHDLAETSDGPTISAVRAWAKETNTAICGSFIARTGNMYFNRAFFVEPSGETSYYDKRHLFSLSDECKVFHQGDRQSPVVRFRGWNIAMAICYDIRFPVWCRNTGYKYDIMLIPANWPDKRGYAWKQLLIARAIENQAYVAGANRSGTDDYGCYDDMSFILDYSGNPIGQSGCDKVSYATLHKDGLELFRRHFPVMNDHDRFIIDL